MLGLKRDLWLLFVLNVAIGFSTQFVTPLFPLYLEGLPAGKSIVRHSFPPGLPCHPGGKGARSPVNSLHPDESAVLFLGCGPNAPDHRGESVGDIRVTCHAAH